MIYRIGCLIGERSDGDAGGEKEKAAKVGGFGDQYGWRYGLLSPRSGHHTARGRFASPALWIFDTRWLAGCQRLLAPFFRSLEYVSIGFGHLIWEEALGEHITTQVRVRAGGTL